MSAHPNHEEREHQDTIIYMDDVFHLITDTSFVVPTLKDVWRPHPTRALWLSTIFPGLGQIYNRSYWKLPIVYGGLMGCAFAITWNNRLYNDYRQAYRDIITDEVLSTDPNRSYNAILAKNGYTIERMGGREQYTATLQNRQNVFHRYRDISIVVAFAVYTLSIIDAFVDARLFDFDISPDLSFNVDTRIDRTFDSRYAAEIHITFRIK